MNKIILLLLSVLFFSCKKEEKEEIHPIQLIGTSWIMTNPEVDTVARIFNYTRLTFGTTETVDRWQLDKSHNQRSVEWLPYKYSNSKVTVEFRDGTFTGMVYPDSITFRKNFGTTVFHRE